VAGLKVQDQIIKIDDNSADSVPDFNLALLKHAPGDHVKIIALRGRAKLLFDVRSVEPNDDLETPGTAWNLVLHELLESIDPTKHLIDDLGVLGMDVDERVAARLPRLRKHSGVIVVATGADEDSPEAPLQPGDVIHALNGSAITTLQDLRSGLNTPIPGTAGVMEVERNGRLRFITLPAD